MAVPSSQMAAVLEARTVDGELTDPDEVGSVETDPSELEICTIFCL
jgi:hypothetical protein